jgi:hypothetical protein
MRSATFETGLTVVAKISISTWYFPDQNIYCIIAVKTCKELNIFILIIRYIES